MQIPILSGIYTDGAPDFRTAYPVNLTPVPVRNGISQGYLRPALGIVHVADVADIDRGGINWEGSLYRVLGTKLCRISDGGGVTVLGDVGAGGRVRMDYSFDRLAIASGGRLYFYDKTSITQVSAPSLGAVNGVIWIDGYFMGHDAETIFTTKLLNQTDFNPLDYASSEIDPDPIVGLLKLRNEAYALNRYTIEVFRNTGKGEGFAFARVNGAQIQRGAIGAHSFCVYADGVAFLGSGRGEALSVYLGANGGSTKISTQEIDEILRGYSETELANAVLEARLDKAQNELWLRLPDRTLVFDANVSAAVGEPAWHIRTTTLDGFSQDRAANLVWCYNGWQVSDPLAPRIGQLDEETSHHWGDPVRWEFGTTLLYNEAKGGLVMRLELIALTGRVEFGKKPRISTSYTVDGVEWSLPREIAAGGFGDRAKRLCWFRQGTWRQWRAQRFQGTSDAHISIARLEADILPLVS